MGYEAPLDPTRGPPTRTLAVALHCGQRNVTSCWLLPRKCLLTVILDESSRAACATETTSYTPRIACCVVCLIAGHTVSEMLN